MSERTIILTLTEAQSNEIAFVCDVALKSAGIKARTALWLVQEIEAAWQKVNNAPPTDIAGPTKP